MMWVYGYGVEDGVLLRVVEGRCVNCLVCRRRVRAGCCGGGMSERANEGGVALAVERPVRAAPIMRKLGVWKRVELGTRQVPAVQSNAHRDVFGVIDCRSCGIGHSPRR